METAVDQLQQSLAALNAKFAAQLPEKLLALEQAMAACLAAGQPIALREQLEAMYRLLHNLSGTAGIFGYAALGERCYALKIQAQALLGADSAHLTPAADLARFEGDFAYWLKWSRANAKPA